MSAGAPTMRAHILVEPGRLELREVPVPQPGPGEVLVRVRTALTCGTDLKMFWRGHPKFPTPTPFGHEFAGEIAAVGADVKGWKEGEPVMLVPTAPCGSCYYCDREQENLCEQLMPGMLLGAYADYVCVPARIVARNLFRKPEALLYGAAALLEPLACVVHALAEVKLRPDDCVAVIGAGAFALLFVMMVRARGVANVVVVTRGGMRAQQARSAGASDVLLGGVENARGGVFERSSGRGADLVIECTGQTEVWEAAPSIARPGAQVVLFGGCAAGTSVRFDTGRLHYDQIRILSPFHFVPRDVRAAYEILCSRRLPVNRLLSGQFPLEHLPEALERLQSGEGAKFEIRTD